MLVKYKIMTVEKFIYIFAQHVSNGHQSGEFTPLFSLCIVVTGNYNQPLSWKRTNAQDWVPHKEGGRKLSTRSNSRANSRATGRKNVAYLETPNFLTNFVPNWEIKEPEWNPEVGRWGGDLWFEKEKIRIINRHKNGNWQNYQLVQCFKEITLLI